MRNKQTIIVFDFETGSTNPLTTEPIQIAACPINPDTLQIDYKNCFNSLIKPNDFDALQDEALRINGKTKEMLMEAPARSIVWNDFAKWVKQFNRSGKYFDAPISAGYYSINFDWIIYDRLCREFGYVDKDGQPNLFSTYIKIDLLWELWGWFEATNDVKNYKLDTFRDYFGLSKEGAHDALVDVQQTAEILVRFMKFKRAIYAKSGSQFKGSFSKSK